MAKKEITIRILMAILVFSLLGIFFALISINQGGYVRVYFFRGEKLTPIFRQVPKNLDRGKFALAELLKGPGAVEGKEGYFTQIPQNTVALSMRLKNGVAIINFNDRLATFGGGSDRVRGIIAQIVYTLTEIRGIKKVNILIQGKHKLVLGGEGYVIDRPLERKDVRF